jgi:hypothetical protein
LEFIMAGTAGIQNALIIRADITTGSAAEDYAVSRAGSVVDAWVIATGASTNGTVTVNKGASAITDAMTCAVDTTVDRAATINDANISFSAGDTLRFVCAGDAVASTICIACVTFLPAVADSTALT